MLIRFVSVISLQYIVGVVAVYVNAADKLISISVQIINSLLSPMAIYYMNFSIFL